MSRGQIKVYGRHACRALFEARPSDILRGWIAEDLVRPFGDVLRELARMRRPYNVVDPAQLERVAGAKHHEGICFLAVDRRQPELGELLPRLDPESPAHAVYLDGVQNPHNLGAILRVCAFFGATAVLGRHGELPAVSGAARRIAEGGAEHVSVVAVGDPQEALARMRAAGFAIVGTAGDADEELFAAELPRRVLWLFGAERTGLSPRLRSLCDVVVRIGGTGAVESLNVSTACAVSLAEHWRRHRSGG